METAFLPGYDPALDLASNKKTFPHEENEELALHIRRKEQDHVDDIISGKETGHYYVFLGSKVRVLSDEIKQKMTVVCRGQGKRP